MADRYKGYLGVGPGALRPDSTQSPADNPFAQQPLPLPGCSWCDAPAVFRIADRGGCSEHIEVAVSSAMQPFKDALAAFSSGRIG